MDIQKVEAYLIENRKYFPEDKIFQLRDMLIRLPDDKFFPIATIDLKDPDSLLFVSFLGGIFGFDRFFIGDIGMGVLKLLTGGCCGILAIIDLFNIQKLTKEHNFNKLMTVLSSAYSYQNTNNTF